MTDRGPFDAMCPDLLEHNPRRKRKRGRTKIMLAKTIKSAIAIEFERKDRFWTSRFRGHVSAFRANDGPGGAKAGDWNAKRRARDIIKPDGLA